MQATRHTSTQAARNNAPAAANRIGTPDLAAALLVKQQSIRAGYCRDGHYLGMVPTKMANGRLIWDHDEADRLRAGEPAKTPNDAIIAAHMVRKADDKAKRIASEVERPTSVESAPHPGTPAQVQSMVGGEK